MSILTDGVVPGGAGAGGGAAGGNAGGNAGGAAAAAPSGEAGAALAAAVAQSDRPEYVPEKYWDPEKKAPRVEDMGRAYQSLEKLLGREKVPIPTGDDDTEGWERWAKATGRPDNPDGYKFERPTLPEALPYDDEMEKEFRAMAFANGLNGRQAKNFYDGFVKRQLERHQAYDQHQKQASAQVQDALKREHGAAYDGKLAMAKGVLAAHADPDFLKYLDETGQGNDPRMMRFLINLGEKVGGETRLRGPTPTQAASAQDAERAYRTFREQHKDALWDRYHPEHNRIVGEMNELAKKAFGDQPVAVL